MKPISFLLASFSSIVISAFMSTNAMAQQSKPTIAKAATAATATATASTKAANTNLNFSLSGIDSNNKKINLQSYVGKTILVTFYKAGCIVCARDLKLVREFYRDNKHKNFVVIGVNLDTLKSEFDLYIRLIGLTVPQNQQFPLLWRNEPSYKDSFGTMPSDPTHFLIDSDGQLIFKREGTFLPQDWDNLWEHLDG